MKILDLAFKGKVTLPLEKEQDFLKDFEDLLAKHDAYFDDRSLFAGKFPHL